jgi:ribose 5-phosphate isomerase B
MVRFEAKMKIALGADHAGFALKQQLVVKLAANGHEILDLGAGSDASTDYPDYAAAVAHAVTSGQAQRGVLVCSTGVGMAIAANKIRGIRAALAVNAEEVGLTRAHNDANVLTIGARYLDAKTALELIDIFLQTEFEGGRHARRLAKIAGMETQDGNPA